jgi:hypothetical protein
MKQCVDCALENLPETSRFCPECGNPVSIATTPPSSRASSSSASKTTAARLAIENAKRRQNEMIAKRTATTSPPSTLPRNMKLSSSSSSNDASTADSANAGGFTMAFDNVLAAIDQLAGDSTDAFPDVPSAPPPTLPTRSFSPPVASRPAPLVSASSGAVKSATQYGQISQIMRPGAAGGAGAAPAASVSPRDGVPARPSAVPQLAVGTKASRAAGLDVGGGSANSSAKQLGWCVSGRDCCQCHAKTHW